MHRNSTKSIRSKNIYQTFIFEAGATLSFHNRCCKYTISKEILKCIRTTFELLVVQYLCPLIGP